jgi:arabinose-5-phosphate isomerase
LNHPGGRLGKRLTLRVCDLMHAEAAHPTVRPEAALLDAVREIGRGGLGAVSVVDAGGLLVGIITDGDVRRTLQRGRLADLEDLKCGDIMTRDPVVVAPDALAYAALRLMEDRPSQISVIPVVEGDGRAVGLVRIHDIVRSGI